MTGAVKQFDDQITLNVAIMLAIKERAYNQTDYFSSRIDTFSEKIYHFLNDERDVNI